MIKKLHQVIIYKYFFHQTLAGQSYFFIQRCLEVGHRFDHKLYDFGGLVGIVYTEDHRLWYRLAFGIQIFENLVQFFFLPVKLNLFKQLLWNVFFFIKEPNKHTLWKKRPFLSQTHWRPYRTPRPTHSGCTCWPVEVPNSFRVWTSWTAWSSTWRRCLRWGSRTNANGSRHALDSADQKET